MILHQPSTFGSSRPRSIYTDRRMRISTSGHSQRKLLTLAYDMHLTFQLIIDASNAPERIWPILQPTLFQYMRQNEIFLVDPPGSQYRDEEKITILMCLKGPRSGAGDPVVQLPTGSVDTFSVTEVKKWAERYTGLPTDTATGLKRYLVFLGA